MIALGGTNIVKAYLGSTELKNIAIGDKLLLSSGYPDNAIMTKETNPEVLAICYAQGWCSHSSYMTDTEAAAVTSIGTVFYNNKNVTHFDEFEYFTSVTAISANGFRGCTSLTTLTIPKNVTSLGNDAFRASGIKTLVIKALNIDTWGNAYTFMDNVIEYFYCNSAKTSPIGARLTSLKTVVLDENVRTVAGFMNATLLTSVNIAEGSTTFSDNCFKNCSSLVSITLPSTTTTMTSGVFNTCANLTSVTILATNPPSSVNVYTFQNTPNAIVYVPDSSVNTYKTDTGWSRYASRIKGISELPTT